MTAGEREAVKLIRDLQARIGELERANERLRVTLAQQTAKRRKADDLSRHLAGVLVSNGMVVER